VAMLGLGCFGRNACRCWIRAISTLASPRNCLFSPAQYIVHVSYSAPLAYNVHVLYSAQLAYNVHVLYSAQLAYEKTAYAGRPVAWYARVSACVRAWYYVSERAYVCACVCVRVGVRAARGWVRVRSDAFTHG
jgi:hypothetical protein